MRSQRMHATVFACSSHLFCVSLVKVHLLVSCNSPIQEKGLWLVLEHYSAHEIALLVVLREFWVVWSHDLIHGIIQRASTNVEL